VAGWWRFPGASLSLSAAFKNLTEEHVKRLRDELAPRKTAVPVIAVEIPPTSRYDALLPSARAGAFDEVPA